MSSVIYQFNTKIVFFSCDFSILYFSRPLKKCVSILRKNSHLLTLTSKAVVYDRGLQSNMT